MKTIIDFEYHLLNDEVPSKYIENFLQDECEYPFNLLQKLSKTEQSPIHHPEGNVLVHTLMVVDMAAKVKQNSKNIREFMWAALLHDVGKPKTTKLRDGKITSYNHDVVGQELSKEFLNFFFDDEKFVNNVSNLVRYHMHILFVVNGMGENKIRQMANEVDIKEVGLLGLCDRMGRLNANIIEQTKKIEEFYNICKNVCT